MEKILPLQQKSIVCFRNTDNKILSKQWYADQKSNVEEERLRIVKAAAEMICEDIRLKIYDTKHYPQTDDFLKNEEKIYHQLLTAYLGP